MVIPDIIIIIKVKLCSLCVRLVPKAEELSCFCKLTTGEVIFFHNYDYASKVNLRAIRQCKLY